MAKKTPTRTKRTSTPEPDSSRFPDLPFELPKVTAKERERAACLLAALREHYADAHCELTFSSPHELLIATILSAQATDAGVNKATPALFKRFPTPADYVVPGVTPADIEPYIKSIGLFRMKAKSIHAAMKDVVERFGGSVPRTMPELLTLRGVARKTANVVLGNAFHIQAGIPVDTHVTRLSSRFNLLKEAEESNPAKIERRLMALFPRDQWSHAGHMLIWHGRYACKARCPAPPSKNDPDKAKNGCRDHPVCQKFGEACECRKSS